MYESSCAISADGATIYRGDNGGVFYAFDKSGFIKWKYDTGIEGMISVSPALSANGIIYFTTGWSTSVKPTDKGYLYALRASDGILLWKYEVGWSSCAPALANGNLYVVGKNGSDFGVLYSFTTESYESLTSEYTVEFGGTQFACSITSKSTTSNFVFNQSLRKISFNLTTNELDGYCNVMFPTQLLGGPYAVGIDGLPAEATESSNATCTSLYITYTQGNHTIEVLGTSAIPEFLTTPTIMLLLFSLPTVLFLQQRKKLKHRAALPHSAT
jgi:outer membrane protein assembly factor BamB